MEKKKEVRWVREQRKRRLRRGLVAAAAALVILAVALFDFFLPFESLRPAADLPDRKAGLRLHFLDVGQGDCTIVEFPSGNVLVVDAGDGTFVCRNKLVSYLKGIRPAAVDFLVTHADADHYGGYPALFAAYEVRKVYLPVLPGETEEYAAFLRAVEREGCEAGTLTRYGTIADSGAFVVCLSPYRTGETDENDASAVLYLDYGGVRAVLCGDISSSRERRIAAEYLLDGTIFDRSGRSVRLVGIDVLKASHHGSASSSSEEWLGLLSPSALVVSAGRGNSYGHPAAESLSRYRACVPDGEIYRTDELGDVIVSVSDGTYTVTAVGGKA